MSPEPSAALQDSWPHTSLDLVMQQQAFRMEDTFPEAQQVLKNRATSQVSQVSRPSLAPRDQH